MHFQLLGIIPAQAIATLMGKSDTTRHGEEQVQYSIFLLLKIFERMHIHEVPITMSVVRSLAT